MSDIKRSIFNYGARSLRMLTGVGENLYACPLCRRVFRRESVISGDLTLEHVPPASMKGKGIVLTCRSCNSKTGHTIEAHLHQRQEVFTFINALRGKEEYSGRIRLTMSGTTTNVDATAEDGELRMVVPKAINNPDQRRRQRELLAQIAKDGAWDGYKFNVAPIQRFNPRVADLAYLKAGYLTAFAFLGYNYIMQEGLEAVRKQIATPDEKIITTYMADLAPGLERGRKIICVEEPFEAMAVQIDAKLIFLPPLGSTERFYGRISDILASTLSDFSGGQFPFPNGPEFRWDS